MKLLSDTIRIEHPELPLFLFGHSMGSFLTRRYIQLFHYDIAGVILSGTGGDKGLIGKIGLQIAKWEAKRRGLRTPSPLLDKLTFGHYNKKFEPARDRKSTRLNSSHVAISYAVFCLKKKIMTQIP